MEFTGSWHGMHLGSKSAPQAKCARIAEASCARIAEEDTSPIPSVVKKIGHVKKDQIFVKNDHFLVRPHPVGGLHA